MVASAGRRFSGAEARFSYTRIAISGTQAFQTAVTGGMMTPAATQWSPSPAPDISSAPTMIDKGQAGEHIHDRANVLPRQRNTLAGASQVPISMKRINQAARAR
jgi:hypothetical protein